MSAQKIVNNFQMPTTFPVGIQHQDENMIIIMQQLPHTLYYTESPLHCLRTQQV
jgi:hypothetical protein